MRFELERAAVVTRRRVPFLLLLGDPREPEFRPAVGGIEHDGGGELALGVRLLASRGSDVAQEAMRLGAAGIEIRRAARVGRRAGQIPGFQRLVGGVEKRQHVDARLDRCRTGSGSRSRDRRGGDDSFLQVGRALAGGIRLGGAAELLVRLGEEQLYLGIVRAGRGLEIGDRLVDLPVGHLFPRVSFQVAQLRRAEQRSRPRDLRPDGLRHPREVGAVEISDHDEVGPRGIRGLQVVARAFRIARDVERPRAVQVEVRLAIRRRVGGIGGAGVFFRCLLEATGVKSTLRLGLELFGVLRERDRGHEKEAPEHGERRDRARSHCPPIP